MQNGGDRVVPTQPRIPPPTWLLVDRDLRQGYIGNWGVYTRDLALLPSMTAAAEAVQIAATLARRVARQLLAAQGATEAAQAAIVAGAEEAHAAAEEALAAAEALAAPPDSEEEDDIELDIEADTELHIEEEEDSL